MPLTIIGPTITIAVNLPLAVWALAKEPRNPAYRMFALFALSLVIWNLGGEVFYHGGAAEIWLRLSFIGMSLAPANFLCLALSARRGPAPGAYDHFLLYLLPLALGVLLNPAYVAADAISHSWREGFYELSRPHALLFAGMMLVYLVAALWVSWRHSRIGQEDCEWDFYLVQFPLVVGILCVLAVAYLRQGKTPAVSLWAMVMSQYAMFMMIRHRLVSLELTLTRGITLALSAAVLAACVLLAILLCRILFGEILSPEMSLILVVSVVSLCMLYAALLPRLEEILDRLFHRNRER